MMFHEVAHGLGIKNTIDGKGTVRDGAQGAGRGARGGQGRRARALHGDPAAGAGGAGRRRRSTTTTSPSWPSIFRSIRFGASSAHGRANAAQFTFFQEQGAFTRDSASGRYRVDLPKMRAAVDALAEQILTLPGRRRLRGDQAASWTSAPPFAPELQGDLDRLGTKGIPVDIVFEQGPSVLGLGN